MSSCTRLPTGTPTRPWSQPLMTWPTPTGNWRAARTSRTSRTPCRLVRATDVVDGQMLPGFTTGPVPLMTGVTLSLVTSPCPADHRLGAAPGPADRGAVGRRRGRACAAAAVGGAGAAAVGAAAAAAGLVVVVIWMPTKTATSTAIATPAGRLARGVADGGARRRSAGTRSARGPDWSLIVLRHPVGHRGKLRTPYSSGTSRRRTSAEPPRRVINRTDGYEFALVRHSSR